MFGGVDITSLMKSPSSFKSPYAAGKVLAHDITKYIENLIIYLL